MDEGNGYQHFDKVRTQVACTVAMLREVYGNLIMSIRREWLTPQDHEGMVLQIAEKKKKYGLNHIVSDGNWAIGRFETSVAAFHCTWYIFLYVKLILFITFLSFNNFTGVFDQKESVTSGWQPIEKN